MKKYTTENGKEIVNALAIPAYMLEADEFFRTSEVETDFVEDSAWMSEYETCGIVKC